MIGTRRVRGSPMASRSWASSVDMVSPLWRRICGLPAVYVRDTLVSPYFVCSSFRKMQNGNYYCVEGAIGLIHRGFEGSWTTRPSGGVYLT